MSSYVRSELAKTLATLSSIGDDAALIETIGRAAAGCAASLARGGKILFAGNGASAADAQHLAADLVSRYAYDRRGLAAVSLSTDTSVLTAIGNDYGFEFLFARQIEALGVRGDVLVSFTTSGRSPNILRALTSARRLGLATIAFCGRAGLADARDCDIEIRVPASESPRVQEAHIVLGHILCGLIERAACPGG